MIFRDQLLYDCGGLPLFRLVVFDRELDLLTEHSTGVIDLFQCHLDTIVLRDTKARITAGKRPELADFDRILRQNRGARA